MVSSVWRGLGLKFRFFIPRPQNTAVCGRGLAVRPHYTAPTAISVIKPEVIAVHSKKSRHNQGSAPRRFYRTVYRRRKERFYRTDYRGQNSGFSIPRFFKTATFSKMLTAKTALFQNSYRYRLPLTAKSAVNGGFAVNRKNRNTAK